jgi:hypothetical protein
MRGVKIDMTKLVRENGHKVALGNANKNARGDKIGPAGQVMKTREQIMTDYNVSNPKAVKQIGFNSIHEQAMSPAEAVEALRKQKVAAQATQEQTARPRRKISETD